MPLWSRIANTFRPHAVTRDIDDERHTHFDEALAEGRASASVSRAFGRRLRTREATRDPFIIPWLEILGGSGAIEVTSLRWPASAVRHALEPNLATGGR